MEAFNGCAESQAAELHIRCIESRGVRAMSDTPAPEPAPLDPQPLEHAASTHAPLDGEDGDAASPADAVQATGIGAAHDDDELPPDIGPAADTPVTGNGASPVNGKSHPPSDKPEELIPDRDVLIQFVDVMFKNARRDGFVSFRVFQDNGRSEKPVLIQAVRLDDHEFVPLMLIAAQQAANWYEPAVFCPPVCTFKNYRNAKTDNLREGVALSVECDQAPGAARATLEALLGPATVVVESGGEWIERRDRRGRAQGASALAAEEARGHAGGAGHAVRGALAGGQAGRRRPPPTFHRASDALAGRWHRKKTPKLARIVALGRGHRDRSRRGAGEAARGGGGGRAVRTNGAAASAAATARLPIIPRSPRRWR